MVKVPCNILRGPVLENLERDEIVERHGAAERAELAADERQRGPGPTLGELAKGLQRQIETIEAEPRVYEREVVPPVPATDVEPDPIAERRISAQRVENLGDEAKRRVFRVAAQPIFGVPQAGDELAVHPSLISPAGTT